MKKKRFKKVVEWEKKPNAWDLVLGIISFFISIMIFRDVCHYSLPEKIVGVAIIYLLIIVGVLQFKDGSGEGRKVYWEKIK